MYRAHVLVCGGTGCASSGSAKIQDTFKAELEAKGLEKEVALVHTGCHGLCALGPIVEQIGEEMSDRLTVYKCNVDDEGSLAQRFGIMSIPTLILFKGGQPAHTMVGSMPKAELVAELEANL